MTTSRIPSDYYTSDEFTYRNNKNGVITNKTRNGSYNIVEKDYGDHKVIYHIPIEYGDDYDISELENMSTVEEEQSQQKHNSPKLIRRRIIHQYSDFDNDNDYEYVEEVPTITPRNRIYVSPRRQRDTQVVKHIYQPPPASETIEYVYEDDYPDDYDYRLENEEQVEYIVRDRVPQQRYMEEPQPIRRIVYAQDPSVPLSSSRPDPPFLSPPSPVRSPYQPSPRPFVTQKSPTQVPTKPIRRNELSPPPSSRKQQTARSPPILESSVKPNIPKSTEPPLRLMDVIAQNRAKRGSRIPKPKREVDEEKVYDPPTYNRNIIKNGFIVHK
ncbi:unnamed protein product [Rotaria sp. Silwood2]|nr:unnamed protein product [Rotaria sp. Silwood2]CAF4466876.1 unnamed protein product [Rotaria sp. Silwood2]CAF4570788.1 unnamed protein product [Rotaria sp. Silwood2]